MKRLLLIALAAAVLVAMVQTGTVAAGEGTLKGFVSQRRAQHYPWHGAYYHAGWGMPVAQLVPPTAEHQTHWGWGVGNTRVTTIRHKFGRDYPGPGSYRFGMFHPTPPWPSDTDQYGVYYVRGPW